MRLALNLSRYASLLRRQAGWVNQRGIDLPNPKAHSRNLWSNLGQKSRVWCKPLALAFILARCVISPLPSTPITKPVSPNLTRQWQTKIAQTGQNKSSTRSPGCKSNKSIAKLGVLRLTDKIDLQVKSSGENSKVTNSATDGKQTARRWHSRAW